MLILKAVSLGPLHGYGMLQRIQQISGKRSGGLKNLTHPQAKMNGEAIMQIMAIAQPMRNKNNPLSAESAQ